VSPEGVGMERRMITTDCHIAPPFSLVEQLPESYREYFARVERRDDGAHLIQPIPRAMQMMMPEGATQGIKVNDDPATLARAAVGNVCPEARPSFDPVEQLAELERDGVYGAVLIGRISVFETGTPPDVDAVWCRIVNDWLAETWGPYLDRVAPGIHLPFKDVGACVKELERAAAMGLRPALLPDGIFDKPYHLAEWEPLWEAANALKIPLTMHVGGLRHPPVELSTYPGMADISWYTLCCGMGETLGWFAYSGYFEKYPDLHVVMTEGYAGWLPFAIQFFDHHWSDSRFRDMQIGSGPGTPKNQAPPGYYIKRQAHATFMWDPAAIRLRDITGLDCLLWGNDYPHHEGSFPYSQEWVDKQFAGVPESEVDQMVRGNAAKLFRINV
jgi:predicted TIM-barrel fold metal-dependent hydrolase